MESIMSNDRRCYVCGTTTALHVHHIFGGINRKVSDREGCWCYLCAYHHNMSDEGVHFNRELDLKLKRECQEKWERNGSRDEWRKKFGKSYI